MSRSSPDPNLLAYLAYWAERQPNKVLFTFLCDGEDDYEDVTYGELNHQVGSVAAWLFERGLTAGDRAILVYPPGLAFPVVLLGCLLAGIVPVPVYPPRLHKDGLASLRGIVRDTRARAILASTPLTAKLAPLLADEPGFGSEFELVDLERDAPATTSPPPPARTDGIAYLQYTSGATGVPKGVIIGHAGLMANLAHIAESFGLNEDSVGVFWLPPYHDMGLVGSIFSTIHCGGSSVLMPPITFIQKPVRWLSAISKHRGTVAGAPNFAYDLCTDKISAGQRQGLDLSSWSVAFNGAEAIRQRTLQAFAAGFAPYGFRPQRFFPCYGLAEATLLVTGSFGMTCSAQHHPGAEPAVGSGAVEPARADVRVVSVDSGLPLSDGEAGEICVSGPSLALGYWDKPAETQATFQGRVLAGRPFLRTGDMGFLSENHLYVTGRLKEMIIIRGRNYYPADIESAIEASHPALHANGCAVFAMDEGTQERLVVVQEVRRDHLRRLNGDEAIDAIRRVIATSFDLRPDAVILIRPATLPKTANGKIQRYACRQALQDGLLEIVAQWQSSDSPQSEGSSDWLPPRTDGQASGSGPAMRHWVVRRIARELGVTAESLDPDRAIADYGLDSLQQATLVGELSEMAGFSLPIELFARYPTAEALAGYVAVALDVQARLAELAPEQRRPLLTQLANARTGQAIDPEADIPQAFYRVDHFPEVQELRQREASLAAARLPNPFFIVSDGISNDHLVLEGQEFLNYSSNNYLGLNGHPEVSRAAQTAIERYGTGASASRIVAGEKPIHRELERALADFVGTEDCLTFVGGNTANVSTIGHLLGERDLVLYDERSHDSVLKGIKLAGTDSYAFRHNSWQELAKVLEAKRRRYEKVLVFVEGIYSMDGDIPDLPRFVEVKRRHGALLMVDECLSIGVLGATGRGIGEHFGLDPADVDIWMGGISKALASCGGYIAGSACLIDYLRYTTPGFVFTTAMSPANAAAAYAALRVLRSEPWRVARLHERSEQFRWRARESGFDTGTSEGTPVVPVFARSTEECMILYKHLHDRRVNVQPIFYPAVPANAPRLRFFVSCTHTEADVEYTLAALAEAWRMLERAAVQTAPPDAAP